jgi:aryl-alcohol dehydrogenase-like predicted oxidoreductase
MSPQTTPAQLPVGQIGFGAMRITGQGIWGPPRDESEAIALLRRVVDTGVSFIDTADSYGPGSARIKSGLIAANRSMSSSARSLTCSA